MNGFEPHGSTPGGQPGQTPGSYLFALTDGGGTVPPELGVARRLVDRGHHVTVLADESMAEQSRRTDALGTLPVRGIVTTGPAVRVDQLRVPANVSVLASAPHSEIMRHADLVISHGGHGTVVKALAAGLPLVILHHGRDQADNAVRVTSRGAGITVSRRAAAPKIARAVAAVLDSPAYRMAARELGLAVAHDAATSTALLLDALED